MRRKNVLKWIREQAESIPEDFYGVWHKYHPRSEKDKDGHYFEKHFEEHPINHARRLKRIWDRTHSFEELDKYFNKYDLQLNYQP